VTVAATFRDYGSTWDEAYQQEVGRSVVAWFASLGRDGRALEGGTSGNLNLYGGIFEATAEVLGQVLPFDPVESRHLLNALVALLGAAGTALLARRLGGSRAAFFAAALLLTTPWWWGHGFANSKDVPFAAAWPWILLTLLRAADDLPRPGFGRLAVAGAALGAGLAARPGGLLLLLPLAAGTWGVRLLPLLLRAPPAARGRAGARSLLRFAAVVGIGWLGMLAIWPYGLRNPLSGPVAAASLARKFQWEQPVRFAGGWYESTHLPRGYAPGWFIATLPETWFVVAVAGLAAATLAWRRGRARPALDAAWLDPALVAVAGLGPILAAVALRPVMYDGVRHLLFVLTALAAFAGWALSRSLDVLPKIGGRLALALTAILAALAVADAVRLHPYQYLYFNRSVAGGLAGASRDYELDYWGATGREAVAWVVQNVPVLPGTTITVGTTADRSTAEHWVASDPAARGRFSFAEVEPPDLRLATTRWYAHRATGRVLHVVERMGVPLLYVLDTALAGGAPLVLEGGEFGVVLPPTAGWSGTPQVEAGRERAVHVLSRVIGVPARVEVRFWPAREDAPDADALGREATSLASRELGALPEELDVRPLAGPNARGWIVTRRAGAERGVSFAAVAALRVEDAAISIIARYDADPEGSAWELMRWLSGARLAAPEERRRP
jgi:hypothetical protein